MAKNSFKFYWFTFADGFRQCVRGYSAQERKVMEREHGKIISKIEA